MPLHHYQPGRQASIAKKSLHSAKCAGWYRPVAWQAAWKPSHSCLCATAVQMVRCPNLLAWGSDGDRLSICTRWQSGGTASCPHSHRIRVLAQGSSHPFGADTPLCAPACTVRQQYTVIEAIDLMFWTAPFVVVTGPSPQRPVRGLRGLSQPFQLADSKG